MTNNGLFVRIKRMLPPPKFVFGSEGGPSIRRGEALDSIVCQGAIISGGQVHRSVLGPNVRINSYASIEDCILFEDVEVGSTMSRMRRVIVDKGVKIPAETDIGTRS